MSNPSLSDTRYSTQEDYENQNSLRYLSTLNPQPLIASFQPIMYNLLQRFPFIVGQTSLILNRLLFQQSFWKHFTPFQRASFPTPSHLALYVCFCVCVCHNENGNLNKANTRNTTKHSLQGQWNKQLTVTQSTMQPTARSGVQPMYVGTQLLRHSDSIEEEA